jgi:Phage integrase, N-terminal SAM-like domain
VGGAIARTDLAAAEATAQDLAARRDSGGRERCSLTLAVYLTQRWLPSKQLTLHASTHDSYRRNISLHVIPHIGRVPLRHLRPDHFERLYA